MFNTFKLYPFVRPLLFSMDAETAHEMTLKSLQKAHHCKATRELLKGSHTLLPTTLMGLPLRNPIGLAAGLDKNGECIDALGQLGFGFIEVGTVTPRAQPGNPKPRMFRLPQAESLINRMGFNNHGLDTFLQNVQQSEWRAKRGVLGLNIGKNADTPIENAASDYLIGLEGVYPFADYVTINISSPNTKNLRALQGGDELSDLLRQIADKRKELADRYGRRVPVVVKIAPDLEAGQIQAIAHILPRYEIDGVIATNTTLSRSAVQGLKHSEESGGLSGPPVHELSLKVIESLRKEMGPDFTIIGVGGINSGKQALEKINAGANAVQLYTGLIYQGPKLIADCINTLRKSDIFMRK